MPNRHQHSNRRGVIASNFVWNLNAMVGQLLMRNILALAPRHVAARAVPLLRMMLRRILHAGMAAQTLTPVERHPLVWRGVCLAFMGIMTGGARHPIAAYTLAIALEQRFVLRCRTASQPDLALVHKIRHAIEERIAQLIR